VVRGQQQLDRVPATPDSYEDILYLFTSSFATEFFHTKLLD
jgi:hypothetical protein